MSFVQIFTSYPRLYAHQRFFEEGEKLGFSMKFLEPKDCFYPNAQDGHILHRITGVNGDDFDLDYSHHHQGNGGQVINSPQFLTKVREKPRQVLMLEKAKVPLLPYFVFRGVWDMEKKRKVQETFFPFGDLVVLKLYRGNQGKGIILSRWGMQLDSLLETFFVMKDQKLLLQPYIEHRREYRLFCLGDEILVALEKKVDESDFRANYSQKAVSEVCYQRTPFQKIVSQIHSKMNFDYSAIDLLILNNKKYVIDVNGIPGIKEVEKISQINIAKKVMELFN